VALAQRQYNLIIVARSQARLEALAADLRHQHGIAVEVLVADLTDAEALHEVAVRVRHDDALTLLVNNAGFGTTGPFATLTSDEEEAEIRLNVMALVCLTHAALPGMIARRQGAIINVSSLAALFPGPYHATYGATKAYVNSFTEALHEELRGTGVHIQALCPGFTHTEFQQRAGVDTSRIPRFAWMTADTVVEASLQALLRRQVICVPGGLNRFLAFLLGVLPRPLVRRTLGCLAARVLAK
jgi:short-subunit dehydrogenase